MGKYKGMSFKEIMGEEKTHINTYWLKEPYNGSCDSFYSKEINALEGLG